jgi:hypothetical protein
MILIEFNDIIWMFLIFKRAIFHRRIEPEGICPRNRDRIDLKMIGISL